MSSQAKHGIAWENAYLKGKLVIGFDYIILRHYKLA